MISYLDSEIFYLVFLGWLIGICFFNSVILLLRYKNYKVSMWIIANRFLLISSIAVFILISIPYLYINIFEVPIFNVILSNVYTLLLCVSAIIYEYIVIQEDLSSLKKPLVKKEGNL